MSFIKKLEGSSVSRVARLHDYCQVIFSNDSILTLYSPYKVLKLENEVKLEQVEGLTVEFINVVEDELIDISFSKNVSLHIILDSNIFDGPEILELNIPNEPIMVWDIN